jgi:neutral ceramidase
VDAVIRAGAVAGVITPAIGMRMAGYARRTGPAEGVLDDLMCRVLVLDDGSTRLVLAVCDLLYATVPMTQLVRRKIQDRLSIPAAHVMVTATHTHAGPGGLAQADTPLLEDMSERVVVLVAEACARLVPARILVGETRIGGVSLNRRDPGGPRDDRARVVALLSSDDQGTPIATLAIFACHPTILEHDTRAYSGDYPGAACRQIEQAVGGTAVFLQGCSGDINPAYSGHTSAECARVGGIIGAAIARTVLELAALPAGLRSINLSWGEEVDVLPDVSGRIVPPAPLQSMQLEVGAAPRPRPTADAVIIASAVIQARVEAAKQLHEQREISAQASALWAEGLFAAHDEVFDSMDVPDSDQEVPLEVQAFRLGRGLVLVGLPGEPFAETGFAIAADQTAEVLVAGYANAAAGYLPTETEFLASGYEAGCSLYAPGTAEALTRAAQKLVKALTSSGTVVT